MTLATLDRPAEPGALIGIGRVTKWRPADLDAKIELERDVLIPRGLEGAALEAEAIRLLKEQYRIKPTGRSQSRNTLTTAGAGALLDALIGTAITVFSNANAALGVGDSSAAFALSQTNLQGTTVTTDRIRKAMNATYPSRATNVLTAQSTFATTEANFVWNEWALFNNVTDGSGIMLNRAVANLGTKTSAAAWQLTITITQT